ncbi:hypothetical protein B0J13DRAFT_644091 [Dactylonectria estremocensis]|uniref:Uncharacterized protein n=1 Tax=Dactylonectria estremocensis TaxID=1079267 RepID=A0A9P9FEK2_9HYPO|nr:hypothetical protein B0J13DRAFT_644091 [Dactylonectria estremocensis]
MATEETNALRLLVSMSTQNQFRKRTTPEPDYGDTRRPESNNYPPHGPSHGPSRGKGTDNLDSHKVRSQEATYSQEIQRLHAILDSANSSIETLTAELQVKEALGLQLKKRNNAMQSFRDAEEELLGRQEQDSTISADFEALFLQLKSWTSKCCSAADSLMAVTDAHRQNLQMIRRVLPNLADVEKLPDFLPVGNVRRRRKFIRGWIGLVLSEQMIRSLPGPLHPTSLGCDVWLPLKVSESVRELETTLLSSGGAMTPTSFHRWRTTTMALLGKVYPAGRWTQDTIDSIEEQVDFALSVIKPLTTRADEEELRVKLIQNIFIPAVELSQLLRRQCASWSVRFPILLDADGLQQSEGAVFNVFEPSKMKDMDSQSDDDDDDDDGGLVASADHCLKAVEIFVRLALFKSGNHDGLRYDIVSTVQKAEVSCVDIRTVE